ncbi:MAG TPA: hypothetical protein VFO60_07925 [Candidatus Dormibacteraeota bacterium]|nr:hypothetical protein [Candidatus Dormibacteraeota bacterium]
MDLLPVTPAGAAGEGTARPRPRHARPAAPSAKRRRRAERPWIDPAVVALSCQRPDGEWRFCPWMTAGREDLY